MRVAGSPFKRGNGGRTGCEAELGGRPPGEGAANPPVGIGPAEQKPSIVLGVEKGIVHGERNVARSEIERNGLVVPEELAALHFEAIDGKSEELLDSVRAGKGAGLALRKVGGAVGIESNVDNGLLEDNFVKAELGTEKRADLQAGDDAVGMGQRVVGGGFVAAYSGIWREP